MQQSNRMLPVGVGTVVTIVGGAASGLGGGHAQLPSSVYVSGATRAEGGNRSFNFDTIVEQVDAAESVAISGAGTLQVEQEVKVANTEALGIDRRLTVAITLFAVMAILFGVDWIVGAPVLVAIGGFLGSAGCFIAASAKRKSVEFGG